MPYDTNEIKFTDITDSRHKVEVVSMMQALYAEDQASSPVDRSHFTATVEFLLANPSRGRILAFREGESLRGYALLVPYWSNEFGGNLLYIDELFVVPEARNRGISRRFFAYLQRTRPYDPVALALEVTPANTNARRLYESLGFELRRNSTFTLRVNV
jgi:GNAT superfamily N-acetyltransferase